MAVRFLVEDIMSRAVVCDDLPLVDWTYSNDLNRPGALSGSLPVTSPMATVELIEPWRRAIYAERDGRIEWGGPIVATPRSLGAEKVQITCLGWLGYWDDRYIRTPFTPTQVDQFEIFRRLITDAQDESVFGPGWNLHINVLWDDPSGVLRDRTDDYQPWKQKKIGDALRELAGSSDGFDFAAEFVADPTTNTISRDIRLHYPSRGRRTNFLYELERGQPSAIIQWGSAESGDFAWVGDGWGGGSDANRLHVATLDTRARGVYPPVDASLSFSGVTQLSTLTDQTISGIARTSRPVRLPVLRVDPYGSPSWSDLTLGDAVLVRIDDGYGSVGMDGPTEYRIIGQKVTSAGVHELTLFEPQRIDQPVAVGGESGMPIVIGQPGPPTPTGLQLVSGDGFVILVWDAGLRPDTPMGLAAVAGDGLVRLSWLDSTASPAPRPPVLTSATPGSSSVTLAWTQS